MSYPSLQEQDAFLKAIMASNDYMKCPVAGGSWMSKKTCLKRQRAKTVYRYRSDKVSAGECLYLECKECPNNKTPKRIKHFDNGSWRKTKRCENRIDTWARGEGFESIVEAILCVSGDIWYKELAGMCGVSYFFFNNWLKKRGIPMRSRSETSALVRKNLRIARWRNDNRRAIRP